MGLGFDKLTGLRIVGYEYTDAAIFVPVTQVSDQRLLEEERLRDIFFSRRGSERPSDLGCRFAAISLGDRLAGKVELVTRGELVATKKGIGIYVFPITRELSDSIVLPCAKIEDFKPVEVITDGYILDRGAVCGWVDRRFDFRNRVDTLI